MQSSVWVKCSLQPRTSSLRSEHASLRSVWQGVASAQGKGPTRAQRQTLRPSPSHSTASQILSYVSICDWGTRGQVIRETPVRHPGPRGTKRGSLVVYMTKRTGESFGRCVETSRFGYSNRELLALCSCRHMTVFVVLDISAVMYLL